MNQSPDLTAPLPEGEGLGVGAPTSARGEHPHPTLPLKGEGFKNVRGSFVAGDGYCFGDADEHAFGIAQHIIVPETDHGVTELLDLARPLNVGQVVSVLPAINFDHQSQTAAGEIGNIITDPELACKLNAKLTTAQMRPQPLFRVRRIGAQFSRNRRSPLASHSPNTPTQPLIAKIA